MIFGSLILTGALSLGFGGIACKDAPRYIQYEACDGEVVIMKEELESATNADPEKTKYIFDDRSSDDLANQELVTVEDMDYLINHYVKIHPESVLAGTGTAFITASNETGMDPLFFFALCGVESGWGTSDIHIRECNPYSLGMYGDGVHNGYVVGETFADGIVNGAVYIYENYYKKGQKTLYQMNHSGDHSFCAGDPNWEYQIESEMLYLRYLLDRR